MLQWVITGPNGVRTVRKARSEFEAVFEMLPMDKKCLHNIPHNGTTARVPISLEQFHVALKVPRKRRVKQG